MRFLRHLTAVVLTVAVVVGLGMLWAHAAGGGTGGGSALSRVRAGEAPPRLKEIRAGVIRVRPDSGFHFADTADLIQTGEIEAALAAVVITVSVVRRRHRRMRRGAAALPLVLAWPGSLPAG